MAYQAQAQSRQSQANQGKREFFDLHTIGIGYLSRIRWVKIDNNGRKADPFLCCCINALHGACDKPSYTSFDVTVSGKDAMELIESLAPKLKAKCKVLVSFRIGDIYPHLYERKVRDKNGNETGEMETAAIIKGRLLLINSIKVDGQPFYRRPRNDAEGQQQAPDDPQPPAQPAGAAVNQQPAAQPLEPLTGRLAPAPASSQKQNVETPCEEPLEEEVYDNVF